MNTSRHIIDKSTLAEFCQRHDIRKLSLFGSVIRDDFDPTQSDVDVLVEFSPAANRRLTYFTLARMRYELETIIGLPVDLSLADSLDPHIEPHITATAQIQYVAA